MAQISITPGTSSSLSGKPIEGRLRIIPSLGFPAGETWSLNLTEENLVGLEAALGPIFAARAERRRLERDRQIAAVREELAAARAAHVAADRRLAELLRS